MTAIPTCLITSIGGYELFEPIVVESAEVGTTQKELDLRCEFGSVGANLYRASHQLFTLAFALRHGSAETRDKGKTIPADFLLELFGFAEGSSEAPAFTAATVIVLGEKLEDGGRNGTVICGPDWITMAEDGNWWIYGGNVMSEQAIPDSGPIVPDEQRMFYNQGLPMRIVADADEAARIWREKCGFDPDSASRIAETLRWNVPEEGEGLALPVFEKGAFTLKFPNPESCSQLKNVPAGPGVPLEFERYAGKKSASALPGLLPYMKTGF